MPRVILLPETGLTNHALWAAALAWYPGDVEAGLRRHLQRIPPLPERHEEAGGMRVSPWPFSPLPPARLAEEWASLGPSSELAALLERWEQGIAQIGEGVPLHQGEIWTGVGSAALLLEKTQELWAAPLPRPEPWEEVSALLGGGEVLVHLGRAGKVTREALALLKALGVRFGEPTAISPRRIGRGTDGQVWVSLWEEGGEERQEVAVVETNLDDVQPEFYPYLVERLLQAGALDVWLIPALMKKGRPGIWVQVLCRPEEAERFARWLFRETTTLGVRVQRLQRLCLPRRVVSVETPYGPVRVKVAWGSEGLWKASPEYEDCRRLAESRGIPLHEVYRAALVAAYQQPPAGERDAEERFEDHGQGNPYQPRGVGDQSRHPGERNAD